jgi:hypothetical protein
MGNRVWGAFQFLEFLDGRYNARPMGDRRQG